MGMVVAVCTMLFAGQPTWALAQAATTDFGAQVNCTTGVGEAPKGACACPVKRGMVPWVCEAIVVQADWVTQVGCEVGYPFTVETRVRWR